MPVADDLDILGFTSLEAEAYCALLQHGPATAYRVSKIIARPTANTYQALASLSQRGALMLQDGEPRQYRAIEPEALLRATDEQFAQRRAAAAARLSGLARKSDDERVYRLSSAEQVLERARAIMRGAREILLCDMFPLVLDHFADEIANAARRGVVVAGLIYSDAPRVADTFVRSSLSADLLKRWPGAQLTVVADASHMLTALLDESLSSVKSAFATDNSFLACMQHSGLSAEIRLVAIQNGEGDRLKPVSLLNAYPDGLARLLGEPVES
ncbi:MAG TPA: helix-turn-helix domain-containing protein [Sphingomicrobium sp.]|nr:helix-turn-helix domain-containing protein [Sphingomicrobium sp.]